MFNNVIFIFNDMSNTNIVNSYILKNSMYINQDVYEQ